MCFKFELSSPSLLDNPTLENLRHGSDAPPLKTIFPLRRRWKHLQNISVQNADVTRKKTESVWSLIDPTFIL